jgi:nitrate/nitrite transporter NarK
VQKIAVLCICAIGLFAIAPLFWTLPTAFLSSTAATGGIALINSIGNLAGFAASYIMGYLKDTTGGFSTGLLAVSILPFLSSSWFSRLATIRPSNAPWRLPSEPPEVPGAAAQPFSGMTVS